MKKFDDIEESECTMAWVKTEFDTKLDRVRCLMALSDVECLLLTSQTNFYWLTGGRPYINQSVEKAAGDLLVTKDKVFLIVNNIEAERLLTEELPGLEIEGATFPWWESTGASTRLGQLAAGKQVVTDNELGLKLAKLRWQLLPTEQERFADTGLAAGAVLDAVGLAIEPGMSELEIAAIMRQEAASRGVNPWVALVAVDDRAYKYRHPVPTAKKLAKYAMLVISGRKHGLYASATRSVHFGPIPADLKYRHEAVAKVDTAFIGSTQPGATVRDAFQTGLAAYQAVGFGDEWQNHHQGGMAGYNSREFRVTKDNTELIAAGQAYAWNPTIAGVKSEDTFIVGDNGPQFVTVTSQFPMHETKINGWCLQRPGILER